MKDSQRSKVYNWENYLPNGDHVPFSKISEVVNDVWAKMGLMYPPLVKEMPKQNTTKMADATRFVLRFGEDGCCYRIILHEIAHAMTSKVEGVSHQHNEVFVGMYMVLMDRFMKLDPNMLYQSAEMCGVKFTKNEKPRVTNDWN